MTPTRKTLQLDELLASGREQLRPSPSARLDAELLLGFLLDLSRSQLLARGEEAAPAGVERDYLALLARRAAGVPIAYLTGRHEFWSLPLRVTPAVLVPRPETELVVERALALVGDAEASAADLGTGSGAIALALASERRGWRVLATDQSPAALEVARGNAAALGLSTVRFAQGNWCGALPRERFQLIVSNPPYLAADDPALGDPVLQHEPRGALVSGPDGLEAYRAILDDVAGYLRPGGWLVFEHGATQAAALAALLVAGGFTHVRCHPDLAGLERVTEARAP
ncbi:MAG TPA: peptide chain release factor N(5)-glutamine methyltransferase [Steroidobacteraceae bacterium]|nr:peptide chain release factor N(5)-glutamine methyltransferase [Steroidobacteraceae bacterium]